MYRAVAWLAVQQGLSVEDQASLTVLAEKADIQFKVSHRGQQKIFCNHIDVTHVIRSPQISRLVSEIAAVPGVRQALVKMQQSLAADQNVVMDGRDAGTVILPQAQCKIYLTASVEERARRRLAQMQRLGLTQPMDEVIRDIKQRDYQDVHRSTSPLKPAEDAILLDCTDLDLDETISEVLKIILNSKQDH